MDLENMVSGNSQAQKTTCSVSSTDIKFPEKTIRVSKQTSGCLGLGVEEEANGKNGHKGALAADENVAETELW